MANTSERKRLQKVPMPVTCAKMNRELATMPICPFINPARFCSVEIASVPEGCSAASKSGSREKYLRYTQREERRSRGNAMIMGVCDV